MRLELVWCILYKQNKISHLSETLFPPDRAAAVELDWQRAGVLQGRQQEVERLVPLTLTSWRLQRSSLVLYGHLTRLVHLHFDEKGFERNIRQNLKLLSESLRLLILLVTPGVIQKAFLGCTSITMKSTRFLGKTQRWLNGEFDRCWANVWCGSTGCQSPTHNLSTFKITLFKSLACSQQVIDI